MSPSRTSDSTALKSPDEVFSLLGNETRVRILQTLGECETPLSFTELRERVGIAAGKEFHYHLDKLVGYFVAKNEDGYSLREPGRRIVKAIYAGTTTEVPTLERVGIDHLCQLCGSPIEVQYSHGRVEVFCSACDGLWTKDGSSPEGYLGARYLPPAGIHGRRPGAVYRTAWLWTHRKILSVACGVCPNCSATLREHVEVCESHEPSPDRCSACGRRYAIRVHFQCQHCIFEEGGTGAVAVAATQELLDFMTNRGLNPVHPTSIKDVQRVYSDFDEDIRSTDPLEASFTFRIEDETLSLTIGDDLTVIDTST